MSITDELRKWAEEFWEFAYSKFDDQSNLIAIADRIDAEHQKAIHELNGLAEVSVLLPRDADGEYIHIGDVMVYADGNTCPMEVVALVPPAVFITEDGPRYADMCRHHHAPTVEDVLREFARDFDRWRDYDGPINKAPSNPVAEYAKRLTLAEGECA